ncbi:ATP-binding protein [Levilinea saccharolytica]|uniref:ATPase n=2 Tax=Levilinea saccharolytica TaxID=229921 RepID=A0A0P6Y263_9CHLR|nr:ATP-binding protein [Levilinea saccharolytica]KPL91748.1 hypothetical protein ADN01_00160 [Levilinea saccharolytica]GAP17540.1 predicted ATPase [Levilinea saccharolytica]
MPVLFQRDALTEMTPFLFTEDVIVIHGARQVGKTSILMVLQEQLRSQGQSVAYLDLEDSRLTSVLNRGVDEFLMLLREDGYDTQSLAQSGNKLFVMIDEIQYLENPSSFLKLVADHHRSIKLIVSGSSSFEMKSKFKDSLVGRTVNFEIFPLSFAEFLEFKGIAFAPAPHYTEKKIAELQAAYLEFALYGGYPKIVLASDLAVKEKYLQQIIDTYIRKDIRDLADIKDVNKFNQLIEILASQSGSLLNMAELANTCNLARQTVERYLLILEQTYIIRLVRPFSRNLRTELTKTPKIFFYDTGLMQMLWLKRLQKEVLGSVFETSVFGELVKRFGRDAVYYWRTTDKKEIDFILRTPEKLCPIETKLHFPRGIPAALENFGENYSGLASAGRVIALQGTPNHPQMVYPWQV